MKKLNSLLLTISIIGFNLISTSIFAQVTDPGLPMEIDPGTPAPINDWIVPMMALGVVFLFFYYRKQEVVEIKKNH